MIRLVVGDMRKSMVGGLAELVAHIYFLHLIVINHCVILLQLEKTVYSFHIKNVHAQSTL